MTVLNKNIPWWAFLLFGETPTEPQQNNTDTDTNNTTNHTNENSTETNNTIINETNITA